MKLWQQAFTTCPGMWSENHYRKLHPKGRSAPLVDPKNFKDWYAKLDPKVSAHIKPCKRRKYRWFGKKLEPRWAKIEAPLGEPGYNPMKTRKFVVCIDSRSEHAGNIYYDDPKALLYYKFICSMIARPIHLTVKTAYHISLLGLGKAIFDGVRKGDDKKEFKARIVRALADCIRTPLYETALLLVSIAAVLCAPVSPELLYDFRAFTGQLSCELYWGKRHELLIDLTPCMWRVANLMNCDQNLEYQKPRDGVPYRDKSSPILIALDNGLFDAS